jgi:hypothetical protein
MRRYAAAVSTLIGQLSAVVEGAGVTGDSRSHSPRAFRVGCPNPHPVGDSAPIQVASVVRKALRRDARPTSRTHRPRTSRQSCGRPTRARIVTTMCRNSTTFGIRVAGHDTLFVGDAPTRRGRDVLPGLRPRRRRPPTSAPAPCSNWSGLAALLRPDRRPWPACSAAGCPTSPVQLAAATRLRPVGAGYTSAVEAAVPYRSIWTPRPGTER